MNNGEAAQKLDCQFRPQKGIGIEISTSSWISKSYRKNSKEENSQHKLIDHGCVEAKSKPK